MTFERIGDIIFTENFEINLLLFFVATIIIVKLVTYYFEFSLHNQEINFDALVKFIAYGFFLAFIFLAKMILVKQPTEDIGFMNYFAILFALIEFVDSVCELLFKPLVAMVVARLKNGKRYSEEFE